MWTALLIVHGLLAVLLLGAVTHQALAALWPTRDGASMISRFRRVSAPVYTNTVVIIFVITFIIGAVIYPAYRLNVRTYLQDYRMFWAEGAFEIKEHLAAMGLFLLPLYWYLWRRPVTAAAHETERAQRIAQGALAGLIAVAAWTSFFVGHILNNIRGLFGT